jgi:hypothetical protein
LAAQGGLQGGGHTHLNKETTLRILSRLAVAALAVLGILGLAVGAYAAVTGTVTPNSGLHNLDTVTVHADGLPASTVIKVLECTHGALDSSGCEAGTNDQTHQSNSAGTYNAQYQVMTLPNSIFPASSITCDDTHPCDVYIGANFNDFSAPKTFVPISFAPVQATTTTTQGPITPEVGKTIALPLSAFAVLGGGFIVTLRRRRRIAGAAK